MAVNSLNAGERVTLLSGPYMGQSGTVAMICYDWQPNVDLVYVRLDALDAEPAIVTRRISDEVARATTVQAIESEAAHA